MVRSESESRPSEARSRLLEHGQPRLLRGGHPLRRRRPHRRRGAGDPGHLLSPLPRQGRPRPRLPAEADQSHPRPGRHGRRRRAPGGRHAPGHRVRPSPRASSPPASAGAPSSTPPPSTPTPITPCTRPSSPTGSGSSTPSPTLMAEHPGDSAPNPPPATSSCCATARWPPAASSTRPWSAKPSSAASKGSSEHTPPPPTLFTAVTDRVRIPCAAQAHDGSGRVGEHQGRPVRATVRPTAPLGRRRTPGPPQPVVGGFGERGRQLQLTVGQMVDVIPPVSG